MTDYVSFQFSITLFVIALAFGLIGMLTFGGGAVAADERTALGVIIALLGMLVLIAAYVTGFAAFVLFIGAVAEVVMSGV